MRLPDTYPRNFTIGPSPPVRGADGKEVILAGHRVATFNSEAGLGFDLAYRPGSLKEMLKHMGSGQPGGGIRAEPMRPEYIERDPSPGIDGAAGRRAGSHLSGRHGVVRRALCR